MSSGYFYSSFTSKWHKTFCQLGYPELDVRFIRDGGHFTGEWAIYQMFHPPTVASLVKWQDVLTGLKNIEINRSILKTFAESIDLKKQMMWDREIRKTKAVEDEFDAREKHSLEMVDRASEAITKNPDLMNRIAKNGMMEIHPYKIFKNIPRYRF